jgi:hypothetical protein
LCVLVQHHTLTHTVDYHSVVSEERCFNPTFLYCVLQQLLAKQVRPFLFFYTQQFVNWVNGGGLQRDYPGTPAPLPRYIRQDLPFNVYDATTYKKLNSPCPWPNGPICSVSKASEVLYNLNPDVVDQKFTARTKLWSI